MATVGDVQECGSSDRSRSPRRAASPTAVGTVKERAPTDVAAPSATATDDEHREARERHFRLTLCHALVENEMPWRYIVERQIERYAAYAQPDLAFVLGQSGIFYFEETSEIYQAAVTICTATKAQLEECYPELNRRMSRKTRSAKIKAFLTRLRDVQEEAARATGS